MTTAIAREGNYLIKRPFFSFMDRTFRAFDEAGGLVMFVRHPLLKLREQSPKIVVQPLVSASDSHVLANHVRSEPDQLCAQFVEANRWEAHDIEVFLQTWRGIDPESRAAALKGPAVSRLSEQLADKIHVVGLLLDGEPSESERRKQYELLKVMAGDLSIVSP